MEEMMVMHCDGSVADRSAKFSSKGSDPSALDASALDASALSL